MKIGLYNVDSKIPNLALMKISTYHKTKGDEVDWCQTKDEAMFFDKVYGSQIFTDSIHWDAPHLELGGSGVSLKKKLPLEIEDMKPDYSIYPGYKDSVGFSTRGCIRKCEFCFVPEMEGAITECRAPEDIWRGGNLFLMDNNILGLPGKFKEVLTFCEGKKIKVEFNQGLDVRLMSGGNTNLFLKHKRRILKPKFAFDDLKYRPAVEKFCKTPGVPSRMNWYVYVDENWESALERCLILKRLNQKPYLMRNKRIAKDKKYVVLAHWCNNVVGGFFKHDFWEHYQWYISPKT